MAVLDGSLKVLRDQVNWAAPNRSKTSDGWIGDEDHQGRDSAHNPQDTEDSSDGNDPDEQVDAIDITHDPANNCDVGKIFENIRLSRDRRARLFIFNRRQFSSYARDGYPPFTWRPYYGSNPHTLHGHAETNDLYNDDTTPWSIGMAYTDKDVEVAIWRIAAMAYGHDVAMGGPAKGEKIWFTAQMKAILAAAQQDDQVVVDVSDEVQAELDEISTKIEEIPAKTVAQFGQELTDQP